MRWNRAKPWGRRGDCIWDQLLIMQVKQSRADAELVIVSPTKELKSCQAHQDVAGGPAGKFLPSCTEYEGEAESKANLHKLKLQQFTSAVFRICYKRTIHDIKIILKVNRNVTDFNLIVSANS